MNSPVQSENRFPLLDADVIRSFVAIADLGSFTGAARHVFRTPSALSMQIRRLEETLGHALFVRAPRKVSLTPEGELLLGYARRLLQLNDEAVSQFLAPPLAGPVAFGTSDDIGTRILPRVLAQFARAHPAVQVDVLVGRSMDMAARLDAGTLDVALVTAGNDGQDSRHGEVVHSEELVWAAVEGGSAALRTPLPLSLACQGCAWRRMALSALDRAGRPYRVVFTSDSSAGQEASMLADLAVAPFPASLLRPPLRRLGEETGLPAIGRYQVLLLRKPQLTEAAQTLARYAIEALGRPRN